MLRRDKRPEPLKQHGLETLTNIATESPLMFDFRPDPAASTPALHQQLCDAAAALTADEPDGVANMANVAALLWEFLPDLNWSGFYRVGSTKEADGRELVLGPFVGKPACIRIPFGQGVCGVAALSAQTQLVADVHAFPGHIACDAASRSELVVPIIQCAEVIAVIDLDSPTPSRFTDADAVGLEALAKLLAERI